MGSRVATSLWRDEAWYLWHVCIGSSICACCLCAHVNMNMPHGGVGCPTAKRKRKKEKKNAMFDLFGHGRLAHSMSWMVVAQFGLQIPSFTWSAACNSNSVSHIAPPHLQTHPLACSLSLFVFFFLSEYYIFADVSGSNCKVRGGGAGRWNREGGVRKKSQGTSDPEANCGFMRWGLRPGHRWIM